MADISLERGNAPPRCAPVITAEHSRIILCRRSTTQPHSASKRQVLLHDADVAHGPLQGEPLSEPCPLLRILLHLGLPRTLFMRVFLSPPPLDYPLSIHSCLFYLRASSCITLICHCARCRILYNDSVKTF